MDAWKALLPKRQQRNSWSSVKWYNCELMRQYILAVPLFWEPSAPNLNTLHSDMAERPCPGSKIHTTSIYTRISEQYRFGRVGFRQYHVGALWWIVTFKCNARETASQKVWIFSMSTQNTQESFAQMVTAALNGQERRVYPRFPSCRSLLRSVEFVHGFSSSTIVISALWTS